MFKRFWNLILLKALQFLGLFLFFRNRKHIHQDQKSNYNDRKNKNILMIWHLLSHKSKHMLNYPKKTSLWFGTFWVASRNRHTPWSTLVASVLLNCCPNRNANACELRTAAHISNNPATIPPSHPLSTKSDLSRVNCNKIGKV